MPKKNPAQFTLFTVFLHVSTSDLALQWLKMTGLMCTLIYDMLVIALEVTVLKVTVTVTVTVTVDDCGSTLDYAL